jgi:hypothetical protein
LAGATIVIKNYVGVGTTAYDYRWGGNNTMHDTFFFGQYALLARLMSVAFPRLSIVDAKWTSIHGPGGNDFVRTNKLCASTDPLAVDWYSAKYILTPAVGIPWWTNPDYPGGMYFYTFGNWARYLMDSTSHRVTRDSAQISVYRWTWAPVPIQLSRFVASLVHHRHVRLDWTTLTETNNYGFEIQRRTAGQAEFLTLPNSFIPGHGTTIVPHSYSYLDTTVLPGRVWYRLKQIDLDGSIHFTDPISIEVVTDVVRKDLPLEFALLQNHPNPFNPATEIRYQTSEVSHVTLKVYDLLGREVATLVNELQDAGDKSVQFNARNLASGMYLYTLTAGSFTATRKLVVMK